MPTIKRNMLPVRVTGDAFMPKVTVDGRDLPGLGNVEIRLPVGEVPQVALHAIAGPLDVDITAAVVLVKLRDSQDGTERTYRLTAEEPVRVTDPEAHFLNERRKAEESLRE